MEKSTQRYQGVVPHIAAKHFLLQIGAPLYKFEYLNVNLCAVILTLEK